MRWDTGVTCPRCKDGRLETYLADDQEDSKKPVYLFICSKCDFAGNWFFFARSRCG